MPQNSKFIYTSIFLFFILAGTFEGCTSSDKKSVDEVTEINTTPTYVGSSSCMSCHTDEYNDWKKSDHFLAMLPATDSTVLGDFDDASYKADGVQYKFFRKDGKYYINTEGEDGKYHDFEVEYTFGYWPLQQYLISFPGGRMQATRASWDARENKWFHQYSGEDIHHGDWLHWTGNAQNWNTMCASCHSTNLLKNYEYATDTYNTTWDEVNVSCESCHGPGSRHISYINAGEYTNGNKIENSGLHYANDPNPRIQLNTCTHCHSRKAEIAESKFASEEIMDDLIPQVISTEYYHADGQILEEDYVYGSFIQSKMYHNAVNCSSCHNPHSGKTKMVGNDLCMQCHEPKYNSPEHHFHEQGSAGGSCIECHMTATTYMGNDHRRDHSFRIPRPDQTVRYGTPNACTSCHTDQTPKWAADAVVKWYGKQRAYHFSDDLIPGSLMNENSAAHLIKLSADVTQPEIARATAAYYLGNIQNQQSADALLLALKDKKAMVRYNALRSLANFPQGIWLNAAYNGLTDKVRAVRIAAADLYHGLPDNAIPQQFKAAYSLADEENRAYIEYQTDFAVGNSLLADYELKGGDENKAIELYLRALEKDSLMNYARLNLSAAYNLNGNNAASLQILHDAAAVDPTNDRIFFNLGLLNYEMGAVEKAMENFDQAVQLGSQNPRLYYNYGLGLQQLGKMEESEVILLKGFNMSPQDETINYALAYFYVQQNQLEKAKRHVELLYRINPNNPDYQPFFRNYQF